MSHDCEECGQRCHCDGDLVLRGQPRNCVHRTGVPGTCRALDEDEDHRREFEEFMDELDEEDV